MSNKNIIIISILSIIAIVITTASFTYAYLSTNSVQENPNIINSACFDLSLADETPITLTKAYPISDVVGKTLTPYKFTLTNNCDTNTNYTVILNVKATTPETILNKIKYAIGTEAPSFLKDASTTVPTNYKKDASFSHSYVIKTGNLSGTTKSVTYELRLWIDEGATLDIKGQTFSAQLSIYSEAI